MSVSNYLGRLASQQSEIWNAYGFIAKYVGSGGFPGGPIYGVLDTDLSLSNSPSLQTASGSGAFMDMARAGLDAIGDTAVSKVKFLGPVVKLFTDHMKQRLGHSIAESIQIYEGESGRPSISVSTFLVPGLFGFTDYSLVETWAAYGTMPKNIAGEKFVFGQYLYSPGKVKPGGFIDLKGDLFSLKINNICNIPGGLYLTNISRSYSLDRDENGKPIFCKLSLTFEYYRECFADEFAGFFTF